jgi:hypothetical protein
MADIDIDEYGLFSDNLGLGDEAEPVLGPDVVDVRRQDPPNVAKGLYEKLKGKKMPEAFNHTNVNPKVPGVQKLEPTEVSAEPPTPNIETEALKKSFQVCLDDEANLEGLEDPDLVNHMEHARSAYAEDIIAEKRRAPNLDMLKATHKQVLVEINTLLREVENQKAERQRNTDEICVHSSNAKRLSAGPTANTPPPHGFPGLKTPVPAKCLEAFKRLGAQMAEDGDLSQKSVVFCEDTLKRLTLLRRSIESLLDALWRLAENPNQSL